MTPEEGDDALWYLSIALITIQVVALLVEGIVLGGSNV